jgi:hypothetical protein
MNGGSLTKDEYAQRVKDAASTILYELGVEEWKKENPGDGFHHFWDEVDGHDKLHSVIDGIIAGIDWKEAIEFLEVTEQNPDHVDSGIYEGCDWKKILICLAFEVFSWDVMAQAEELFDADEAIAAIASYPTNDRQIGFYPGSKSYYTRNTSLNVVVVCSNFIKVIFQQKGRAFDAVVFEGKVDQTPRKTTVKCRRIYLQGFEGRKIQDILPECGGFGVYGVSNANDDDN